MTRKNLKNYVLYSVKYIGPDRSLTGATALMRKTDDPDICFVQLDDIGRFPILSHGWHGFKSEYWQVEYEVAP